MMTAPATFSFGTSFYFWYFFSYGETRGLIGRA